MSKGEEFKEVSVPLKAMKTVVGFARSSQSPSTASKGDKMKQTPTACETVVNLKKEAEVMNEDLEESSAFLECGTNEEEYAEIEASLFRSLLNVTFHGKTYINSFPFNGLKRLLVVCLPLKRFRKSLEALEHPLKFSL